MEHIARRIPVGALAFGVCVIAVLVLALMPAPPAKLSTGWDKANHLLAFGVMAWLGCKAFERHIFSLLCGLLAYGAVIEMLQSLTPNRSAEWQDWVADGVGILLGWMVWRMQKGYGRYINNSYLRLFHEDHKAKDLKKQPTGR